MYLFFLIFPLILFPVYGESIPDYDNPYSPIFTDKPVYTWTDKITMTIIAPSWNANRNQIDSIGDTVDHPIKISTREHSLSPYRFTETDTNSGIFTAEITLSGFLHDTDGDGSFDTVPKTTGTGPTSGFLEVDRDSAVTISFEFADGVVVSESVPVKWNLGSIAFLSEDFFSDDSVMVRVVDSDMNLNPESLDSVLIQLYSDSDAAGITIDAIETSESSGLFVATASLSHMLPSSGNRLYSVPGDTLFAKYNDHTLPKPYSISDNLEVEIFTTINSSVPATQRLENSSISFYDGFGNQLKSFESNNQINIGGTVTNKQDFTQKFVYLLQVKNSDNYVESISWIQGELLSNQSLDVAQYWVTEKPGTYQVETFVWNSIADSVPLAPSMSTLITVE